MRRGEVFGEGGSVAPLFGDVDRSGIEQVLRISVCDSPRLGAAGGDHLHHRGPCGFEPVRGQFYSSEDYDHPKFSISDAPNPRSP